MTENGYTKEEILKGERIILQVGVLISVSRPLLTVTADSQL